MPWDAAGPGTRMDDDDALMARAAAGEQAASRALIARHGPRALGLAVSMLADRAEAEDVAQEAMLRLWKQAPKWRPGEAQVGTWLHRVVQNLAIDRLRRRRRWSQEDPPERPDGAPGAEARLAEADRAAALRGAISALPDRQRAALTLRHFAELSNPEIAARLELSVEAVESLLARARRSLAAALRDRRDLLGLEAGLDPAGDG
ncbi:MAG: RNA polymerase sigma factor [Albimonas sp.]|uniref:RNA polymerase sigma factor n=1 Tax=Albimonas sp. TaxID=1872425 RepID=UPI004057A9B3